MDKEIVNILKKYGCAFMETDNKEMLEEIVAFAKEQGKAINYSQCCTELKDRVKPTFDDWLKLNFKKINSTTYGNKNLDCVWLKSELREIYETISL